MAISNEGHVISKGAKIYYQERGTGDPLILLMGFGADGDLWEKHVAVYERYFRCIILDNRGVGRSDAPPGPYTTAMMAEDTVAVMKHLNINIAKVAGISMGGAIAQELAIRHSNMVSALVLISTWGKFNNYAKTVYQNLKKLRSVSDPADFMELLQLWIFAPPHYDDHLEELKEDQQSAVHNQRPQSQVGFEAQLDACINHDTVSRLSKITVPTLITVGSMDIFTPPSFSYTLHEGIRNSSLVAFPFGGHVHHWEALHRFNVVTKNFLLDH
ncbi:MAG: alpha/beta fold hydrolase [Saprospiraceae bacterium]|nr:alpha/beta fold hydrolase [Saprospiraceae bacterium]